MLSEIRYYPKVKYHMISFIRHCLKGVGGTIMMENMSVVPGVTSGREGGLAAKGNL